MVKSERERKTYNEEIPGIELQNWIGARMKEGSVKDDAKVPSRGLNPMMDGAGETGHKYVGETLLRFTNRAGNAGKPFIYEDLSSC